MGRSVPLGLARQRDAGSSCQPACTLAVLGAPADGSCHLPGTLALLGGCLCTPCLGWQSGRSRGVCAHAVARDHISSYIALAMK